MMTNRTLTTINEGNTDRWGAAGHNETVKLEGHNHSIDTQFYQRTEREPDEVGL